LASSIFLPTQLSVGASSSLFGLTGVLLVDLVTILISGIHSKLKTWKITERPWRQLFSHFVSIAITFLIGLLPMVDNFAHLGGLATGLLLSSLLLPFIVFNKNTQSRSMLIKQYCTPGKI
jgi:membrane associated rhomboid family serine protease